MLDNAQKLAEYRKNAQQCIDDICVDILDGERSLVHQLVKMYRVGHSRETALETFQALTDCVAEARDTYLAAISQPSPTIRKESRVKL